MMSDKGKCCGRVVSTESKDGKWFCDLCSRMMDMLYFNWRKIQR